MRRTAIRLKTVAALLHGGTAAAHRVFDSRVDAIDDVAADQRFPVITVRTETDAATKVGGLNRSLELCIEFAIVTAWRDEAGNLVTQNGSIVWSPPETTPQLEATLDLFEYQIVTAMFGAGPWATWWQDGAFIGPIASNPILTSPEDGRVRLAARDLRITLGSLPMDCSPVPVRQGDPVPDTVLPKVLTEVLDYINVNAAEPFKTQCAELRALLASNTLPASPVYPPLNAVRYRVPEAATPAGETPRALIEIEEPKPTPPPP